MKTIYRSEVMNKDFETIAELEEAEKAYREQHKAELELKEARKKDAAHIDELLKTLAEHEKERVERQKADKKAQMEEIKVINKALSDFCKVHGTFRTSLTSIPGLALYEDCLLDTFIKGFFLR